MALASAHAMCSLPNLRVSPLQISRCFRQAPHWAARSQQLQRAVRVRRRAVCVQAVHLKALIFDCDGVILESEDLHRQAYNAAFQHFDICCDGSDRVVWSSEFYDDLQNRVGGGKPKMRDYFGKNGWPSSSLAPEPPQTEDEQVALIDALQDWKTLHYQELIGSGKVKPRPGVLRLMDEARGEGLKLAVCSAATKSSVIFVVEQLLGVERYRGLDVFIAGDDVPKKKPDPSIYKIAAERLQLTPAECLVVEDSTIGMKAALGADMRCIITYTSSTATEGFEGAERIFGDIPEDLTISQLRSPPPEMQDARRQ